MSAHSKAKDPPAIRMVQLIRRFGLMGLVCVWIMCHIEVTINFNCN